MSRPFYLWAAGVDVDEALDHVEETPCPTPAKFIEALQRLDQARPQPIIHVVFVQLVAFECEKGQASERDEQYLGRVRRVFWEMYGFTSDTYLIPHHDASTELEQHLQTVYKNQKREWKRSGARGQFIVIFVGAQGTIQALEAPMSSARDGSMQTVMLLPTIVQPLRVTTRAAFVAFRSKRSTPLSVIFDRFNYSPVENEDRLGYIYDWTLEGPDTARRSDPVTGSLQTIDILCATLTALKNEPFSLERLFQRLQLYKSPSVVLYFGKTSEEYVMVSSLRRDEVPSPQKQDNRVVTLNVFINPSRSGVRVGPWIRWMKYRMPKNVSRVEVLSTENVATFSFVLRITLVSSAIPNTAAWTRWIDVAPSDLQSIVCDIAQTELSDEDTLATFVAQLNFKLGINENLGQRYYKQVTVLPIMWAAPTTGYLKHDELVHHLQELGEMDQELSDIAHVLGKGRFNFSVEKTLRLPQAAYDDRTPSDVLDDGINDLIRKSGRLANSLIIVLYGGHGADTRRGLEGRPGEGDCIWAANTSEKAPQVNWTKRGIHQLENAACDSLMMIDCCFSGTAARRTSESTNEILAAATPNAPSYSGDRAYSKLLATELMTMPVPFTAYALHEKMLAASKSRLSDNPNHLLATPDHGYTVRSRQRSILLRPLEPNGLQSITSDRPFAPAPESSKPRMFVEVELDHLQGLQDCVTEWGRWFVERHPPPNMHGVKFYTPEDMYLKAIPGRQMHSALSGVFLGTRYTHFVM